MTIRIIRHNQNRRAMAPEVSPTPEDILDWRVSGHGGRDMARNPAVKKAAKAAKRKAVVAAKRKIEIAASSFGGRIREAARQPILQCLLSENLFKNGVGTVTLIRGVSREQQHIGVFMLDTFCLGVKDAYFRTVDRQEADCILEIQHQADATAPIAPGEARKLLQDAVAWAAGNGFVAPEEYASLERLFGDVVPAGTNYVARFGHEGRVFYIPGPSESPADIRRRTRLVQSRFGAEAIGSILDFEDDEPDDFDDEYDLEDEIVPGEDGNDGRAIA
jgi:hypothetical protein